MRIDKTPREILTRAASQRSAPLRDPRSMPMDFNLGSDVKLRWIRKFFNGAEEDRDAFFDRKAMGWTPVKAEEVGEKYELLKDNNGNISRHGCVLCKIDAETAAEHVAFYEQKALGLAESAKTEFEREGGQNEAMPKFTEGGKSRVIRGSRPTGL
jgi:hypothetical protein